MIQANERRRTRVRRSFWLCVVLLTCTGSVYKVNAIDPWEMTEWPVGSVLNGSFTATADGHDKVYRFTRYASGEAMRPEARPTASVVEGIAPLTVTFASHTKHQVAWYFSRPLDQPDRSAPAHLDRRNTYNVGPVANQVGPLAIGNFNRSMQSYGYDRQFRGQIKALKVFGSRISGRGSLDSQNHSPQAQKQRVFVLTDISNEPDDEESMVRFLVYANEYDIEGLVATTSTYLRNRTREDLIRRQLDAYAKVRGNLVKHAKGYPTQAQLLAVTTTGQPAYGMKGVGDGKSSAGSQLLLAAADKADKRPLWISVWGGANTLAQALRDAREERSSEELARLIAKLRVYTISDQDDAGRWLRLEFPDLFYIVSPSSTGWEEYCEATWTGISGDRHYSNGPFVDFELVDNPWLEGNVIKNHGPLGALYPKLDYIMEGDTPSFIGLIENGLGWSVSPDYGGWAGRYKLYKSYAETHPIWTNNMHSRDTIEVDGKPHTSDQATIWRWRRHFQHDFAARMDWCVADDYKKANHNPVAVLNGDQSKNIVKITAKPGDRVMLSSDRSSDPDGDTITHHWMIYKEAGTFGGTLHLSHETGKQTSLTTPSSNRNSAIHVILIVQDNGTPSLVAYRRAIIAVQP